MLISFSLGKRFHVNIRVLDIQANPEDFAFIRLDVEGAWRGVGSPQLTITSQLLGLHLLSMSIWNNEGLRIVPVQTTKEGARWN